MLDSFIVAPACSALSVCVTRVEATTACPVARNSKPTVGAWSGSGGCGVPRAAARARGVRRGVLGDSISEPTQRAKKGSWLCYNGRFTFAGVGSRIRNSCLTMGSGPAPESIEEDDDTHLYYSAYGAGVVFVLCSVLFNGCLFFSCTRHVTNFDPPLYSGWSPSGTEAHYLQYCCI